MRTTRQAGGATSLAWERSPTPHKSHLSRSAGKACVLDIDVQGAASVRKSGIPAIFVFVAPPSLEALEARLRGRGTESEEDVQRRLNNARAEMEVAKAKGTFDFILLNDKAEDAAQRLAEVARAAVRGELPGKQGQAVNISAMAGAHEARQAVAADKPAGGEAGGPDGKAVEVEKKAEEELMVPAVEGELPADARVVFVLGGPGSGKGTQCDKIKAAYECVHLSAGDLLRAEVASGSAAGRQLEEIMREGKLVPMSVTIALLRNAMVRSGGSTFLIDGFPRALDQGEAFERDIKQCTCVLFYDCPEDEMERRLMERGKTSGRADDNMETIKKRFHTFIEQSMPVVDKYKAEGKCHVISAVPTPDEVFVETQKALDGAGITRKELAVQAEEVKEEVNA